MSNTITLLEIPLADIDIPDDRARDLDATWAEALGAIIAAQGLTNPVTVRQVDGRYRLVTGLHRLEAIRQLGWETITARVSTARDDDEARLEEVMENLGRAELNALDRCHHLYDLKQVYERLHPETKNGAQGGVGGKRNENEIFAFSVDAAEKIGLSRRSIEIAVAIWSKLTPASRARCAGTWLAGKQSELKLLSAQKPPIQKKVLDLILADPPEADNVQAALDYLESGVKLTDVEKKFLTFSRAFAALPEPDFDRLLSANEERVMASLKRRGRI